MFININNIKSKSGDIRELNNINYCKRYIIIELPESILDLSNITIINLSCSTGNSFLGLLSTKERNQLYNIYHAKGIVLTRIPEIINKDIKNYINYNSYIQIQDYSYGTHNYDLSRGKFNELQTYSSYSLMYENNFNDFIASETMPYPKFYNYEHHRLNEEISNNSIIFGKDLLTKPVILLKDLIDDFTYIYIIKKSNFNYISNNIDESSINITLESLATLIIGPVTFLGTTLMVNELDFVYDSDIDGGNISRIRYKTDHKEPNKLYSTQIISNLLTQFESDMNFVREYSDLSFRLFIHYKIGNVSLRFIHYTKNKGFIQRNFNFDIGAQRNNQHTETIKWIHSPLS